MAYNTSAPRAEYTASATQTVFPFLFKIFATSDIKVYQTLAGATPDDTADILVLTTDYTVTINGDAGGEVTLNTGAAVNDKITLARNLSVTRATEYQQNGDLLASTLNSDQEYQTYLIADNVSNDSRYIKVPDSVQNVSTSLPAPVSDAYVKWNATADAIENDTTIPDAVTTSAANAAAALASEQAAAASATTVADKLHTVNEIADILLLDPLIYPNVNILGYTTANDGGGGLFNYDATINKATANAGTIIDPSVSLALQGTGVGLGCWVRQYSGAVNVKWFGTDGINDSVAFQAALSVGNCYVPDGSYIFTTAVVVPSGRRLSGNPYKNMAGAGAVIMHSIEEAFVTDQTISNFSGITIQNIKIRGGVATKYAIKSHYPYTFIDSVHIETDGGAGRYLGNGIKLHNDGALSGMGCWDSSVTNCKIVCDDSDTVNLRTLLYLDINGGNVKVDKNDFVLGNNGINILRGENINIKNNNFNKIKDISSTDGNIVNATIIVGGTSTKAFDVTISDNYIEGNSRAVLLNSSTNTSIKDNYITDLGAYDPDLAVDGNITISANSTRVLIENNYMEIRYGKQAFILASSDYVSINNHYFHQRYGNVYYGIGRFQGTVPSFNISDELRINDSLGDVTTYLNNITTANITTANITTSTVTKLYVGETSRLATKYFLLNGTGTGLVEIGTIDVSGNSMYRVVGVNGGATGNITESLVWVRYTTARVQDIVKLGSNNITFSVTAGKLYAQSAISIDLNVSIQRMY